jgi:AcrR family transcriptional regulator
MADVAQVRPYRGIDATERVTQRRRRLLDAGLDLLGGDDADAELTVRAVCKQAGLTARYFYESFSDKDEFVAGVYDWVVADIAATMQAAVVAAPPKEQGRAGIANVVRIVADDPRVGRLVFGSTLSNPVVARKRVESTAFFISLLGEHVNATLRAQDDHRIKAATHFVVGGVAQTISAWLDGAVMLRPDELVDQLAAMLRVLSDPRLYRG